MLTIESNHYEVFPARPAPQRVETVDLLDLIDAHQGEQTAGSWLEQACWQIEQTMASCGQPGRVSGGYHTMSGTLFTLTDDMFPTAAANRAIARALAARQVKSCPGAVMVAW